MKNKNALTFDAKRQGVLTQMTRRFIQNSLMLLYKAWSQVKS